MTGIETLFYSSHKYCDNSWKSNRDCPSCYELESELFRICLELKSAWEIVRILDANRKFNLVEIPRPNILRHDKEEAWKDVEKVRHINLK